MDYEALAKQYGGASAPTVDYGALAQQYGGAAAEPEDTGFFSPTQGFFTKPAPPMLGGVPKAPSVPKALVSAPASAAKMVGGIAEAVTSPIETAKGIGRLATGGALNAAEAALPASTFGALKQFLGNPEYVVEAIQTANEAGGALKARYGSPEAFRNTFETDPVGFASDLSMLMGGAGALARVGGATRVGPGLSAAATSIDPVAASINAAARGVSGTGNMLARGVGAVSDLMTPSANQLVTALEGRGPEYIAALRGRGTEIVPGSIPTAGEALAGAGISGTQLPALQAQVAREYAPTAYAERTKAQEAARAKSIETISQTPADLYAAETARAANAGANYKTAMKAQVPADEVLTDLLKTPAMQDAVSIAEDLAANKQRPFQTGKNVPETMAPTSVIDPATGQPFMKTVPGEVATYPGQSLHDLKIALDSMIETKTAKDRALSNKQVAALKDVRDKFVNWVEDKVPDYKIAREQFAAESKPINVMEVGQVLKEALTSPLPSGIERGQTLGAAVRNAPATLKKATGQARFEDLSQVLEAGDSLRVQNVLQDLARTSEYKRLAGLGAKKAGDLVGAELPRSPSYLSTIATTANKILSALEGRINRAGSIRLAESMLNPETAAVAIEQALATKAKTGARVAATRAPFEATAQGLRAGAPAFSAAARSVNALAPPNQNAMRPE